MNDNFVLNDMTDNDYFFLLECIPYGEERAISMTTLAAMIGTSERGVRKLVEDARINGNVIASTGEGYFIPSSRQELAKYIHITESRARTAYMTLSFAKRVLNLSEGDYEQLSVFPE